eukprot:scaffold180_cov311-Pinguiococcus_pyrenoidosus.AAC.4
MLRRRRDGRILSAAGLPSEESARGWRFECCRAIRQRDKLRQLTPRIQRGRRLASAAISSGAPLAPNSGVACP